MIVLRDNIDLLLSDIQSLFVCLIVNKTKWIELRKSELLYDEFRQRGTDSVNFYNHYWLNKFRVFVNDYYPFRCFFEYKFEVQIFDENRAIQSKAKALDCIAYIQK